MKRLTDKQRAFLRSNVRYGPHARNIERLVDSLTEALRDREARMREAVGALEMPRSATFEEAVAANLRAFKVLRKPFKPEGGRVSKLNWVTQSDYSRVAEADGLHVRITWEQPERNYLMAIRRGTTYLVRASGRRLRDMKAAAQRFVDGQEGET